MDDNTTIKETTTTPAAGDEEHPLIFLHAVGRHFRQGDFDARYSQRRRARGLVRSVGGAGCAVRSGKIDAASRRWTARASGRRRSLYRFRRHVAVDGHAAHADAPHRHRLRLSIPSSAVGILGPGERDAAADDPRPGPQGGAARALRSCYPIWGSRIASIIGRRNFRAASSSGSRSPGPSPTRRASCSPTNRPAISMCAPRNMCSRRSGNWCAPPASPQSLRRTISTSPRKWTAA